MLRRMRALLYVNRLGYRVALPAFLCVALATACGGTTDAPETPSPVAPSPLPNPGGGTPAANLAGVWTGTISQPNGSDVETFIYRLTLTQNGSSLEGSGLLETQSGTRYFADHAVSGSISGDIATLRDGQVRSASFPPGVAVCTKTSTLTLNGSRLTGQWTAPGCGPGRIDVFRQ